MIIEEAAAVEKIIYKGMYLYIYIKKIKKIVIFI